MATKVHKMETFSSDDILDRLKTALSLKSDTDLGNRLGVSKAAISNWRKRNTIDYPLVFSFCEHINIDWLITGRGDMELKAPQTNSYLPQSELMDRIVNQAKEIGRLEAELAETKKHAERLAALVDTDASARVG